MGILFFKKIDNGKYRYYEKFYDESEGKWKQASVTLTSKTRQAQGKAKKQLEEKIEKKSLEYDEQYKLKQVFQKMTVREVYDEYKIFRKQELKDSTFAIQNVMLSNILKDILDDLIVNVTSFSIQKYFMISPNSFKYKKTQKSLINLFFKYSLKLGYIEQNPIEKVEIPKQRKDIENIQKKRTKFLSIEEMKILKQSFGNSPQEIRMNYLIEFMYLTGLRIGEALALMWENINLENKIINVKYTLDTNSASIKEFKLNSPKTIDSYRLVSISVRCIEILLNMKKLNVKSKKVNKSFIFLSETDSLINPNSLNIYLKKISRKDCFENKKHEEILFRHYKEASCALIKQ